MAISTSREDCLRFFRRVRPEWWWGVFWLRHFWLIAALGAGVGVGIFFDQRALRRRRAGR